ncbi:MAG: type I-E CRISPR-associated protein Cse1/CasA [Proteobacteria bacterium]|nr:type I-E CRISPR-associated protein Cse1/CasA [Pseudomonadota bacterium]
MGEFSFNLIDEPWIPCVIQSGEYKEMGLKELLLSAHDISGFDLQNPLEEAALYRMLLALVHRIVDGPKDTMAWKELYQSEEFKESKVIEYFEKWHSRFDLFSEEYPFYQTAGLEIIDKDKKSSPVQISSIQTAKANGNTKTLFDHSLDREVLSLPPKEVALILLSAQGYLMGGLNKKTTNFFDYQQSFLHGSMVTGLFCLLMGANLFNTLTLNMLICNADKPIPSQPNDCPVWERDDIGGEGIATPTGYFNYLTCKTRHISLIPEMDNNGTPMVRRLHIAQGESFPDVRSPFGIIRENKKGEIYSVQLEPERMIWRDSSAFFTFGPDADERPKAFRHIGNARLKRLVSLPERHRCAIYALANDKANPLAWRKEMLSIPTDLLAEKKLVDSLRKGLSLIEDGASVLDYAGKSFIRECLPENSKEAEIRSKAESCGFMMIYWDQMESAFHNFIMVVDQGDVSFQELKKRIKTIARNAFKTGIEQRYMSSARTYRSWVRASGLLNSGLAKRLKTGGEQQ